MLVFLCSTDTLSLYVACGLGSASLSLLNPATLAQDLARMANLVPRAHGLLLFASGGTSASAAHTIQDHLRKTFPGASLAGILAAAPKQAAGPTLWVEGRPCGPGSVAAIALGCKVSVATEACHFEAFGPPLEVFEAALERTEYGYKQPRPAVLRKIGTEEEGSIADSTHPGCSIPRRVGLPAAAALRAAMRDANVQNPREVWLGVPGTPRSARTPKVTVGEGDSARAWGLFPWVGVTPEGGVLLGGRGPEAEGLAPKGTLRWVQCFRVAAAHCKAGSGTLPRPPALVLGAAGAPAAALRQRAAAAGGPLLVGTAVLGAEPGGAASWLPRGIVSVAFGTEG